MKIHSLKPFFKPFLFLYLLECFAFLFLILLYPDTSIRILIVFSVIIIVQAMFLLFLKMYFQLLQVEKKTIDTYLQSEAFTQINSLVNPKIPLPMTGDWAATPDFIKEILSAILKYKPSSIVELGSGVSTLYIGRLLKEQKIDCTLYSLESSKEFLDISQKNIDDQEVSEKVTLLYSKIVTHKIDEDTYNWYDTLSLEHIQKIDMLLVDGPSMLLCKQARYPAIPLLNDKLTSKATILVDDYYRKDEAEMVEKWVSKFPIKIIKKVMNVKGFTLLQKK